MNFAAKTFASLVALGACELLLADVQPKEAVKLRMFIKTPKFETKAIVIQNYGELAVLSEKDKIGNGFELQVTSTRDLPTATKSGPSEAIEINMKLYEVGKNFRREIASPQIISTLGSEASVLVESDSGKPQLELRVLAEDHL